MERTTAGVQPLWRRLGPLYACRSIARNRLLIGVPKGQTNDWKDLLVSLGFHDAPVCNSGPLVYWIAWTYGPCTREGRAHTDALIEGLMRHTLGHVPEKWWL